MVFTTMVDITFDLTVWTIKKMYGIGMWAIFGSQKTETELLLENQTKTIELLHKDLVKIAKQLKKIEKRDSNNCILDIATYGSNAETSGVSPCDTDSDEEFEIINSK